MVLIYHCIFLIDLFPGILCVADSHPIKNMVAHNLVLDQLPSATVRHGGSDVRDTQGTRRHRRLCAKPSRAGDHTFWHWSVFRFYQRLGTLLLPLA